MGASYKPLVVGPLETNCYLLWNSETLDAAIIDPGGDRDLITSAINDLGLKVKYILLTHGHFDHAYLAGDLAREYSAEVAMHEADICQLTEGLGIAELFYDMTKYVDFSPSILLNDGDVIRLGDMPVEVLHTPGHSQGGLCFVTELGIFCGDTIFAASIGRTDFPGGDYSQIITSIKAKLFPLKDEVKLYPGHGPATTVGKERATNPYL